MKKPYVSRERPTDQEQEQVAVFTWLWVFLSQVWRPGCPPAKQEQRPRKKQDSFYDTQVKDFFLSRFFLYCFSSGIPEP